MITPPMIPGQKYIFHWRTYFKYLSFSMERVLSKTSCIVECEDYVYKPTPNTEHMVLLKDFNFPGNNPFYLNTDAITRMFSIYEEPIIPDAVFDDEVEEL